MSHRAIDPALDLSEAEAQAILEAEPDTTLVVDYLAGVLSDADAEAFRERLRRDARFRAHAEPLIAAWESIPRVDEVAEALREDLDASWQRFAEKVGLDPRVGPFKEEVRPIDLAVVRRARRLQAWTALLLLVGVPAAAATGYWWATYQVRDLVRVTDARYGTERINLSATSSVTLASGGRLTWDRGPDAKGGRSLELHTGQGVFVLDAVDEGGAHRVRTPAGVIIATRGIVFVEVRDPSLTFVRVEDGEVVLQPDGVGTRYAPTRLKPGERGLMMWGQPPRKAQ